MSNQRLHKTLRRGPWSLATKLLVAWLVLSVAAALAPCCKGIANVFSVPGMHAGAGLADDGDGHDHLQGSGHELCAPSLDHEFEVLPGGASPIFNATLLLTSFIVLLGAPLGSATGRSAELPFLGRLPLYLRLGRLLN